MKVYVAGPDVFRTDASAYADKVRKILSDNGLTPLLPIDNDVEDWRKHPSLIAMEIYAKNVAMIDQADAVIANIEPFRGPHMDPGTAFEIGYAVARGKRVYCYSPHAKTVMVDRIEYVQADGRFWDNGGMMIEDFGNTENLMITVPCVGGVLSTLEEAVAVLVSDLIDTEQKGEEHA